MTPGARLQMTQSGREMPSPIGHPQIGGVNLLVRNRRGMH